MLSPPVVLLLVRAMDQFGWTILDVLQMKIVSFHVLEILLDHITVNTVKMLEQDAMVVIFTTVNVRCYCGTVIGKITTSCVNGDLKLWRAYGVGPAHDGLALYCKSGQWTGVCDDSWKCDNGRLICQKLGYAGILSKERQ